VESMDIPELRAILEEYDIRPSRSRGQHFLVDESVVERQIDHAGIRPGDRILEIGPGTGILTRALACAAPSVEVVAVEKDDRLVECLQDRLHGWNIRNVRLIHADALKMKLPAADLVVSNLPYKISSPVTFRFLGLGFRKAVCLYQKDFARRMTAPPGTKDYGRLSIKMYYHGDCEILETVPPAAFYPRPRVESALVSITPTDPPFELAGEETFFRFLDAVFQHRRKTLRNALKLGWQHFGVTREEMEVVTGEIDIPTKRPEELLPEELAFISEALYEHLCDRGWNDPEAQRRRRLTME